MARNLFVTFLISFALTLAITPLLKRLAVALGVLDRPNERKIHDKPTPYLGGIAFYVSLVGALLWIMSCNDSVWNSRFLWLPVAGMVAMVFGVWDDVRGMRALEKLAGQIIVGLIVYQAGYSIDHLSNPFGGDPIKLGGLSLFATLFWICGFMNAINLIDGLDGLACGVTMIASLSLVAIPLSKVNWDTMEGDWATIAFFLILFGMTLAFLFYNFHPASIFMGDTGAMFLGLMLGVGALQGSMKGTAATALLVPLVIMAIPIVDVLAAIVRRLRRGVHPFRADQHHVHHRLMALGLGQRQAVLLVYSGCACLGIVAFLMSTFPKEHPEYALLLLVVLGLIFFWGMVTLRYVEGVIEAHQQALEGEEAGGSETPRVRESNKVFRMPTRWK